MLVKRVTTKSTYCERNDAGEVVWAFKDTHLRDAISFALAPKGTQKVGRGFLFTEQEANTLLDALTEWSRSVKSRNAIKPGELGDWATLP